MKKITFLSVLLSFLGLSIMSAQPPSMLSNKTVAAHYKKGTTPTTGENISGMHLQQPERQGRGQIGGQMRVLKIAFFSDVLELTAQEAELFWPIYNQYWREREVHNRETRTMLRSFTKEGLKGLSQEQIKELLDKYLESENSFNKITNEYLPKFLAVLPADKVAKMFGAEEQFRMQMLNKVRLVGAGGKEFTDVVVRGGGRGTK